MNINSQNKFYLKLKEKRESQGIEIAEISEQTKINPKYFLAFEDGNFEILPSVYTRLFLRSYAIEIGANPDKALEDFEIHTTGKIQKKNIISSVNKSEEQSNKSNIDDRFFPDDGIFQNINQKNLIGAFFAIIIIIFLIGKLRNITADTSSGLNDIKDNSKQTELNDQKLLFLPGSYLNGFIKLDDKSIKLNISPPYTLNFISDNHSEVNLKIIENGVTSLERILPLKPASPLIRESNGIIEFELRSTQGISISLNEDKEIISQFLKPKNISEADLAIKVRLEEDGNLKAEYFKSN